MLACHTQQFSFVASPGFSGQADVFWHRFVMNSALKWVRGGEISKWNGRVVQGKRSFLIKDTFYLEISNCHCLRRSALYWPLLGSKWCWTSGKSRPDLGAPSTRDPDLKGKINVRAWLKLVASATYEEAGQSIELSWLTFTVYSFISVHCTLRPAIVADIISVMIGIHGTNLKPFFLKRIVCWIHVAPHSINHDGETISLPFGHNSPGIIHTNTHLYTHTHTHTHTHIHHNLSLSLNLP